MSIYSNNHKWQCPECGSDDISVVVDQMWRTEMSVCGGVGNAPVALSMNPDEPVVCELTCLRCGNSGADLEAWIAKCRVYQVLYRVYVRAKDEMDARHAASTAQPKIVTIVPVGEPSTAARIVSRISEFDAKCFDGEYTDTGEVWELLHWIREKLGG